MRASRCGLLLLGLTAASFLEESHAAGFFPSDEFDSVSPVPEENEDQEAHLLSSVPEENEDQDVYAQMPAEVDGEVEGEVRDVEGEFGDVEGEVGDVEGEGEVGDVEGEGGDGEEVGAEIEGGEGEGEEVDDPMTRAITSVDEEEEANRELLNSLIPPSLHTQFSTLRASQRWPDLRDDEVAPLLVLTSLFMLSVMGVVSLFRYYKSVKKDRAVETKDEEELNKFTDKLCEDFSAKVKAYKYMPGKEAPHVEKIYSFGGVSHKVILRVSDPKKHNGDVIDEDFKLVKDKIKSDMQWHCLNLRKDLRPYGMSETKYGDMFTKYGGSETLFRLTVFRR